MSRDQLTIVEKNKIVERFIEACGTDEPIKIKRLLNISYPAARNYLDGRLPDTPVLLKFAKETKHSIDWLLTGKGNKILVDSEEDTQIPAPQTAESVREICVAVFNEEYDKRLSAEPKVVVLQTDRLKSEKAIEPSDALSEKKQV